MRAAGVESWFGKLGSRDRYGLIRGLLRFVGVEKPTRPTLASLLPSGEGVMLNHRYCTFVVLET
eukprot:1099682-Pelagomonas_calceolata.AAC.1